MAHEELKKQYEEDCKKHGGAAYRLWEISHDEKNWSNCTSKPSWSIWANYRHKEPQREEWVLESSNHDFEKGIFSGEFKRKEPPFTPEYFSGLNWRQALPLVGRAVEFSVNPDDKWVKGVLHHLRDIPPHHFIQKHESPVNRCELNRGWLFIRTCPETYAHPIITIGGVELPKPETEEPKIGAKIWVITPFHPDGYYQTAWQGFGGEVFALKNGHIHLTKDRAQEWADWWEETVVKVVNENTN